jgi:hypothetical protein
VIAQRHLDRVGRKVQVLAEAIDEPDHDLAREVSVDFSKVVHRARLPETTIRVVASCGGGFHVGQAVHGLARVLV